MFYRLKYFKKSENGKGICAEDFKAGIKIVTINTKFILSLTDIRRFELPFSGQFVSDYALLTMSNNDTYLINRESFIDLQKSLQ